MRIAVIRPSMFGEPASDALMPLFFAIARGLVPSHIPMDFYDERVEPLPKDIPGDVVLITVETFAARRAYSLADHLRSAGKKVLLGGFHPTMCPEESAGHADAVLTGDAEDTLPPALADLERGRLLPRYDSKGDFDLAKTKYDYSVFTHPRYRLVGLVQFCRGCRFSCDFCSVHAFYPRARFRPVEQVLEDVKKLKQRYLFFIDDNLFSDPVRLDRLLEGLTPLKKRWACQISLDAARDPDLLGRLRAAGCRMAIVGFESLDRANLRQMGKGVNLVSSGYETAIANLRRAGIMIYGTFVVGYDGDRAGTAVELARFASRHGFAIANFNPLMPMPGTPLYRRLLAEGRLPYPQWWTDRSYVYGEAQVEPRGMTGRELTEGCRQARFGFYRPWSILKRLRGANLWPPGNLFLYLAMNAVSGHEIHYKQGRALGGQHETDTH